MQHGLSYSKEQDSEQSLTEEGKKIVKNSAIALKKINIDFDVIICSPKKRSKQTAEMIAEIFKFPKLKIIQTEKIEATVPAEESLEFIKQHEKILLVGHLPSIKEIISYLLDPTSSIEVDVQNAGCTYLQGDAQRSCLKWHLTPGLLKSMI